MCVCVCGTCVLCGVRRAVLGSTSVRKPHELDGEVLGNDVVVLEHDHDVQLELDLERLRGERRACKKLGEGHVHGDVDPACDIAVGKLDVLNFRCCAWRPSASVR